MIPTIAVAPTATTMVPSVITSTRRRRRLRGKEIEQRHRSGNPRRQCLADDVTSAVILLRNRVVQCLIKCSPTHFLISLLFVYSLKYRTYDTTLGFIFLLWL